MMNKDVIIDTIVSMAVAIAMIVNCIVKGIDLDTNAMCLWFIVSWFSASVIINYGIRSLISDVSKIIKEFKKV